MSVLLNPQAARLGILGTTVSKAYSLAVETKTLFTVAGGICLVTSLVGRVTTAITVANTVKLQANPTTGTTGDLCAATDIGTTDTPAGDLLALPAAAGSSLLFGIGTVRNGAGVQFFVDIGTIEQVTATGADGAITWFLTYVPLEDGATIVAA